MSNPQENNEVCATSINDESIDKSAESTKNMQTPTPLTTTPTLTKPSTKPRSPRIKLEGVPAAGDRKRKRSPENVTSIVGAMTLSDNKTSSP
ncbi:hypothetical protein N7486_009608 [Penicillium sp. IBT 16267x]|nr:hypothetical protein N7486_009608 [Penicillium sp. IBT 16267x]